MVKLLQLEVSLFHHSMIIEYIFEYSNLNDAFMYKSNEKRAWCEQAPLTTRKFGFGTQILDSP